MKLFFCANQISYECAVFHIEKYDLMLIHSRVNIKSSLRCIHLTDTKLVRSIVKRLLRYDFFEKIFVPHDRVFFSTSDPRLVKKIHYLDDGLDTLRIIPKNFSKIPVVANSFTTFKEYEGFPVWIRDTPVIKAASISIFLEGDAGFGPPTTDVVVVESTGVNLQVASTYIGENETVTYLVHSNPNKRLKEVPEHWRKHMYGAQTELILKNFRGKIIVGDSMTAVLLNIFQAPDGYELIYIGTELNEVFRTIGKNPIKKIDSSYLNEKNIL